MNLRVPLVERLRARIDRLAEERDAAVAENAMLKLRLVALERRLVRERVEQIEIRSRLLETENARLRKALGRREKRQDLRLVES